MSWVSGIRQCLVEVEENVGTERAGVMTRKQRRVCRVLSRDEVAHIVGGAPRQVTEHRGAGPCGTVLTACVPGALTWTLLMLWPHLAHYERTRPRSTYSKMGPKKGGGNGKSALW
jgi:hypothetical protein